MSDTPEGESDDSVLARIKSPENQKRIDYHLARQEIRREFQSANEALERKFIAIRAENDDMQEETAYYIKQLAIAQHMARDAGKYTFTDGVYVGLAGALLVGIVGWLAVLIWS